MTDAYRQLLIGAGHARDKRIEPRCFVEGALVTIEERRAWRGQLETLDYESPCNPDICWDLNRTPWRRLIGDPSEPHRSEVLPESSYDEVHAYEVLEHLGAQGDYRAFFATFAEIWRVLRPGGFLAATCPSRYSQWLWGDPGHARTIQPCTLQFLSQPAYRAQTGITPMSDYRRVYRADFDILHSFDNRETHAFVLQAVKPARLAQ